MTNTAIPIRYSHTIYRDKETNEELASANSYVAESGWLLRAIAMGHSVPPLLIQPSACSGPGDLPLAKNLNLYMRPSGWARILRSCEFNEYLKQKYEEIF